MDFSKFGEEDFKACCGSTIFAMEMAKSSPFQSFQQAVEAANHIWFNKVDVKGWLEAFEAHPRIGESPPPTHKNDTASQWSKEEQATALVTASDSILEELSDWNLRYMQKFGFVFLICASGRSTPEILSEMKKRHHNRPIVEFEIAAQEQMKITEIRLSKLFSIEEKVASIGPHSPEASSTKAGETSTKSLPQTRTRTRTRPPITTHVLDVARGFPAAGIDVILEKWTGNLKCPFFDNTEIGRWALLGSSCTNEDGRSGQLMDIVDVVESGIYRISFDTGKYCPTGFFPYVSIVFEIRESQKFEHFHVPLLFSPFSLSTYRGS